MSKLVSLSLLALLLATPAAAQSRADTEEPCEPCAELEVRVADLEVKVADLEARNRRLEARSPAPAPAFRVWHGTEVTAGQLWCRLTDLAPGEVLVSSQWLDGEGRWTTGEVLGAGFPIVQHGTEVGFRHLTPCGTVATAFRLVIHTPG